MVSLRGEIMEGIDAKKSGKLIHIELDGIKAIITESRWNDFVQAYREGRGKQFLMAHDIRKTCPHFRELMKEIGREIKE